MKIEIGQFYHNHFGDLVRISSVYSECGRLIYRDDNGRVYSEYGISLELDPRTSLVERTSAWQKP